MKPLFSAQALDIPITLETPDCLPCYMSKEAAGADLKAHVTHPVTIAPGESALIPTGIKVALPEGFEIQIRPRSGLALKHQITVLNTPGTIDSDYRGEIKIILINHGKETFLITPQMRIAQMIVAPVLQAHFIEVEELPSSIRGKNGFGHTGMASDKSS